MNIDLAWQDLSLSQTDNIRAAKNERVLNREMSNSAELARRLLGITVGSLWQSPQDEIKDDS